MPMNLRRIHGIRLWMQADKVAEDLKYLQPVDKHEAVSVTAPLNKQQGRRQRKSGCANTC